MEELAGKKVIFFKLHTVRRHWKKLYSASSVLNHHLLRLRKEGRKEEAKKKFFMFQKSHCPKRKNGGATVAAFYEKSSKEFCSLRPLGTDLIRSLNAILRPQNCCCCNKDWGD